jgi:hypothetical protein
MDSTMKREVPIFLFAFAFALSAQVRFEVPGLGYVHDQEAKTLRSVSGVPGAASLEKPVSDAGGAIERAWISPRGFALVQGKMESALRFFDYARGRKQDLSDASEAAAISMNGRYFAIATGGSVELWDGDTLARQTRFEASGVRGVAISDDGQAALLITGSGLSMWQQNRLQQIWSGDAIAGADFLPASRDFVAFDGGRNKVLAMRAGATTEIDAKSSGAAAFALSGDGRTVALGGERTIEILDTVSGASSTLPTENAVEGFGRAGGNGEIMQVRFRGSTRTSLLEWAGLAAPQIEFLIGGGAQ